MDYQVGDKVIHWNYGLGEIIQMDERLIHERQTLCYVVRIRDLTIWVTADEPEKLSIRMPTPRRDFEKLFAILRSPAEPLPVDRYERRTHLVGRMKDGTLVSMCEVIRDLVSHRRQKALNDNDKLTLERARNFLLAEWAHSLSISSIQANDDLQQMLGVA